MGYELGKRLLDLRKQTDESLSGRWRTKKFVILSIVFLVIARYSFLPTIKHLEVSSEDEEHSKSENDPWVEEIRIIVVERVRFLDDSLFVLVPGSSSLYGSLAAELDNSFNLLAQKQQTSDIVEMPFTFTDILTWLNRLIVSCILRIVFVVLIAWPYWILGTLIGHWVIKKQNRKKPSDTILGVCDRGKSPFYSGIYGPYRPNNKISGTELSCPGLACPPMVERNEAESHALAKVLTNFEAMNDTNLELIRVVLAHKDYPHFVEEENPLQADEIENPFDLSQKVSKTGFVTTEKGLLLDGVIKALPEVLHAHKIVVNYVASLNKGQLTAEDLDKNFPVHVEAIKKLVASVSELTKILVTTLTPARLFALAELSPQLIASAYLSIEAGKCLVYKKHGEVFSRISMYPNLQARAVIHSLVPYHKEYDGDQKLIVRQAIISSRRHGDFSRAFLPIKMPIESRALRDFLEILYTEPSKQGETAELVELDAHIEEVHVNFRGRYTDEIRQANQNESNQHKLKIGLTYKSVVLLPLDKLIETALNGFHRNRLMRISTLLDNTRKFQTRMSTAARLPGFKRQAMEAFSSGEEDDLIIKKILKLPRGKELNEQWRIVRRMLTRYNWLSTRIGDDSVPIVGVVHAILKQLKKDKEEKYLFMDVLVPLRQRRYVEILGKSWEKNFYKNSPYAEDLEIFVKTEDYENVLRTFNAVPAPQDLEIEERAVAIGQS